MLLLRRWLVDKLRLWIAGSIALGIVLCETFYLEFFCNRQEGVKLLLGNIDLPVVHEVQHVEQVWKLHPLEVE